MTLVRRIASPSSATSYCSPEGAQRIPGPGSISCHPGYAFGLALLLACAAPALAQTPWKPSRTVEIVVGVAPGGGVDRTARLLQKVFLEKKLIDVAATVVNKPGGGGILGQAYLSQHAGDAHYLEVSATSILTNQITGKSR